jgi:hypothetical protein
VLTLAPDAESLFKNALNLKASNMIVVVKTVTMMKISTGKHPSYAMSAMRTTAKTAPED